MPLEPYRRGKTYWIRGRVELHGAPITEYYRCSSGASDEAGARDWIAEETDRQRRRHLVGDEAALTFAEAVMLYNQKAARQLLPITVEIGHLPLSAITGQLLRSLGHPRLPSPIYGSRDTSMTNAVSSGQPSCSIVGWRHT